MSKDVFFDCSGGTYTITFSLHPSTMITTYCQFEMPRTAANNGMISCRVRQITREPDDPLYDAYDLYDDDLFLTIIFNGRDTTRALTTDWQIQWTNAPMEGDLATGEKALIQEQLNRLYRLRAFL